MASALHTTVVTECLDTAISFHQLMHILKFLSKNEKLDTEIQTTRAREIPRPDRSTVQIALLLTFYALFSRRKLPCKNLKRKRRAWPSLARRKASLIRDPPKMRRHGYGGKLEGFKLFEGGMTCTKNYLLTSRVWPYTRFRRRGRVVEGAPLLRE